jgi:large subunit ribosomal protein L20
MTRVKRGFVSKNKHKKIIKANKGYKGSHSKLFKIANQENMKSLKYSYSDRKRKKRDFKRLWIKKINATLKTEKKIKYNNLINNLSKCNILLNRKILAILSEFDKKSLIKIIN